VSFSPSSATCFFDVLFLSWQLVRMYVISIDEGFTVHGTQQMMVCGEIVMDMVYTILVDLNQFHQILIFDLTDPDDVFQVYNYNA